MSLEKLYSVIKKKSFEVGQAYIITGSKHLIEAQIYSAVIVRVKSRTLSYEQIIEALLADDISRVNESPENVKLEDIQPLTIEKTFRASAPFAIDPGDTSPQRLFNILRLMAYLAKTPEGFNAFDIMADEILKKYPCFSLERTEIRKRIYDITTDYFSASPFLNSDTIPSNRRLIPDWVFSSGVIADSVLKDVLLYFIFFGEMLQPVARSIVKRESGFGAKTGFARISKVAHSAAANSNSAIIFKGSSKMGELNITFHSENKPGILITQADLGKLYIKDGDTVSLVFNKK